jgi:hypothetical protein
MMPSIARHAITAYSRPGDVVLDPFRGTGTALVEAVRAGRDSVGIEYHPRWPTWPRPTSWGHRVEVPRDAASSYAATPAICSG